MNTWEHDENCLMKKQRIAELLEEFVLDAILSIIEEISSGSNLGSQSVCCIKSGCPERKNVPPF